MSLVGVAIDVSSECRGTFVLICHTISQLCTSHAEYSSRMSSLHSKKAVACMRYTKNSFLKTWTRSVVGTVQATAYCINQGRFPVLHDASVLCQ